jgi:large subunit ribosomal protein L21
MLAPEPSGNFYRKKSNIACCVCLILLYLQPKSRIMYAIVEIAGRQYRVEENKHLVVNRLQAEAGSTIEFSKVLLVGGEKIKVGAPTVAGASVTATVKEHGKGDKVLVFKKKRRKGYQKMNGFRHYLTLLKIESIKS